MPRAQSLPKPPSAPVPVVMADFIIDLMAAVGSVDRDTLKLKFSNAQIDKHFDAAKEIVAAKDFG